MRQSKLIWLQRNQWRKNIRTTKSEAKWANWESELKAQGVEKYPHYILSSQTPNKGGYSTRCFRCIFSVGNYLHKKYYGKHSISEMDDGGFAVDLRKITWVTWWWKKDAYFNPWYATDAADSFGFFSCGCCWRIAFTCCWPFCVWRLNANASLLRVSSTSNFASNFKRFGCVDDGADGIVDDTFAMCGVVNAVASLGPALSNWRTLLDAVSSPLVDAFNLLLLLRISMKLYTFFFFSISVSDTGNGNNYGRSQHV